MRALRLIPLLFAEYWLLATAIPVALTIAWFALRKSIANTNEWIGRFKPIIDVIMGVAALLVALNWLDELKRDNYLSSASPSPSAADASPSPNTPVQPGTSTPSIQSTAYVCQPKTLNVRSCPSSVETQCHVILSLAPGTRVALTGEASYSNAEGKRSRWVKIRFRGTAGWVNDVFLCD